MPSIRTPDVVQPSLDVALERMSEAIAVKQQMLSGPWAAQAVAVAQVMIKSLRLGGKIIFLGNGGSAQDAGHLAAELMGRYRFDRPGLAALSLPDATATMTAIGNDYAYEDVFARQVMAIGRPGDVVVGLSTSGNSVNVVRALEAARAARMTTVALTGVNAGRVAGLADICIQVPSADTGQVQEACLHLGHTISEMVEAAIFATPDTRPR